MQLGIAIWNVLVVAGDEVERARRESVRLRNSVSDINMTMDILVVPYSRFEALREKIGLIYREADQLRVRKRFARVN
jgi:hypothetical protein